MNCRSAIHNVTPFSAAGLSERWAMMAGLKRFGDYAVELGYCTTAEVEQAVETQEDLVKRGFPRTLIGIVMVRYGIIDNNQLIQVLKVLEKQRIPTLAAS